MEDTQMPDTKTENINEGWFEALIEECKSIIVEAEFNSRWTIVEAYHALGKRILEENKNFEREQIYGKKIVHECAKSLGKSERTIYYAIQFYKTYPNLELLPVGKNVSWGAIRTKLLPKPKDEDLDEYKSGKIEGYQTLAENNNLSSYEEIPNEITLTRQLMIDALILGPIVYVKNGDLGKALGRVLLNGNKGLNNYTDHELLQIIRSTYSQEQIYLLCYFYIDFYSELLLEIKKKSK